MLMSFRARIRQMNRLVSGFNQRCQAQKLGPISPARPPLPRLSVAEGRTRGRQVGALLARGPVRRPWRRLRASPGAAGHPPRQDGPPVAARSRPESHPGRLPGWRAGQDHPRERRRRPRRHRIRSAFPAPGADPPARQRRTTSNAAQPRVRNAARAASSKAVSGNGSSSRIRSSRATVGLRSPSIRGRAIWALTGVTKCSQ